MKKKSIIVVTLCTAMALSLTACGSTHAGKQEVSSTSESNAVTIANSFEEFDNLNDAMDFAGFDISTPDSVRELNRSVIRASKEDKIIEIIYGDEEHNIHIRKGYGSGDISGNYNEFAEENAVDIDGLAVTMKGNNGKINIALWNKDGYAYSIDSSDTLDKIAMTDLVKAVSFDSTSGAVGTDSRTWGPQNDDVEIPSPFTDCATIEEAATLSGFSLTAPDKIEGYSQKSIMAIENEMIQILYHNIDEYSELSDKELNEIDWETIDFMPDDVLIRKAISDEDISGDYNEYENIKTVSVNDLQVTMRGNGECVNVATWKDGEYAYAISTSADISSDEMIELVSAVK